MSIKLEQLAKQLPENGYNIAKTARKLQYSDSYIDKGIYTRIGKSRVFSKYFDEKLIRREYKKTLKEAMLAKDLTSKLRCLEGMARIESMFTQNINQNSQVSIKTQEETNILNRYNLLANNS